MNTQKRGRTKQAKFNDLRKRWQFHFANGGGIVGERALCAMRAARAEIWAEHNGVVFEWLFDSSQPYEDALGDHAYWCSAERRERSGYDANGDHIRGYHPQITRSRHEHAVEECVAYKQCPDHGIDCQHAEVLASLSAIIDATTSYKRVVEAELAMAAQELLGG
jgi:hypothetical protein